MTASSTSEPDEASAQAIKARMVECARQALAADPGSYNFGPDALEEVWRFVHELAPAATGAEQPSPKLIDALLAIEDPDDRALAGAAREAARRLAADAGVEVPPPVQDEDPSPLAGVADRTLAAILAKRAQDFHFGAAWGVSETGFWTERAAAHLFRREPIFRPPAEWVAAYACWIEAHTLSVAPIPPPDGTPQEDTGQSAA